MPEVLDEIVHYKRFDDTSANTLNEQANQKEWDKKIDDLAKLLKQNAQLYRETNLPFPLESKF
jgi:hypothetical protein